MRLLTFGLLALIAAGVQAAPDGAALYQEHCSACHGREGTGGVGVPLALKDFLRDAGDEFIALSIREGRPGRVMPAFRSLADAEVKAIVAHIRGWGPPDPGMNRTRIAGDVQRGARLYAEHCAECHGDNGEGGTGTGVSFSRPRDIPIIPPALNNAGFLAAATDLMIKQTLIKGRRGTPKRSALTEGLTERDVNDVVAFVRSFEQRPLARDYDPDPVPFISMESNYSLEETVKNVERAAVGKNFRIIRIQNLEQGLFPEAEEDPRQVIVYFCNFKFVDGALDVDPRVGLFMPCRVTVVERDDGVVEIIAMNPKFMSRLYNNGELDGLCDQMTAIYEEILEEATL